MLTTELLLLIFLLLIVGMILAFAFLLQSAKKRNQPTDPQAASAPAAVYPSNYQPMPLENRHDYIVKVPLRGGIFLLAAMLAGGFALGTLLYAVSQLVYMPIIFPIIVGVIAGVVIRSGVLLNKVRDPLLCVICTVITGIVIYGTFQYMEYQNFRQQQIVLIQNEAVNHGTTVTTTVANVVLDEILQEQAGATGFWGYERFVAQSGVELSILAINRGIPLKFSIPLSGLGVWLYWAVELGLVGVIAALFVYHQANHPFDEDSNQWFGDESDCLGSIPYQQTPEFSACVERGDYVEIGRIMIAEEESSPPDLDIYTMFTPQGEDGNCYLFARQTRRFPDGKSKRSTVFNKIITSQNYHDLVSTFEVDDAT